MTNTESRVVSGGKTPIKSHLLLGSLFSFAASKRLPLKGVYSVQEKDYLVSSIKDTSVLIIRNSHFVYQSL